MKNPILPLILVVAAFSLEAGPLINTRENPLFHGADLSVDFTMALSAVATKVDVNSTFQSILIEDSELSLMEQAAIAAPGSRGPGVGVSETAEDQLAVLEEPKSGVKTTASLIGGAMSLGLAGLLVWRARSHDSKVGLKVDEIAAFMHRMWYWPSILGSREIWGGHGKFWTRVDRILDRVESGRDVFRSKKKA